MDTPDEHAPRDIIDAHPHREAIIVLDYGSQYSRLIVRRVREARVYAEVLPWDAPADRVRALAPRAIILSGGPSSVYEDGAPTLPAYILDLGVPILGICYGMQLLAHHLGGDVRPVERREFGHATVHITRADGLFAGLPAEIRVWASHGDFVRESPPGFDVAATSANAPIAAMAHSERRLYALLFHPEVAHTEGGLALLRNFAYGICGCRGDWTMASVVEDQIAAIRAQVGNGRQLLLGLSGAGGKHRATQRDGARLHDEGAGGHVITEAVVHQIAGDEAGGAHGSRTAPIVGSHTIGFIDGAG